MKSLQDERKKDVEETADFINQLITQSKEDNLAEINRVTSEIDLVRRDLQDRAVLINDLEQTKSNLVDQLETKVDLNEVQSALNECQNDIIQQLNEFKDIIKGELKATQNETFVALDNKADALEIHQVLDRKADSKAVEDNYAEREKMEQLERDVQQLMEQLQFKCDSQKVEEIADDYSEQLKDMRGSLDKKSNIKDVCALLDMKSSKLIYFFVTQLLSCQVTSSFQIFWHLTGCHSVSDSLEVPIWVS